MSATSSHVIGALAALASALCWAIAAILFRRLGDSLPALALNLGKGVIALLCLGALLLPQTWVAVDAYTMAALAFSGVLGIALGDTLYFMALMHLGARVTLVVSTMIPVLTAVAAVVIFGEQLATLAWLGIALTVAGVGVVLWEQVPRDGGATAVRWRGGVFYGGLFVVASAGSILLTKIGVADVPSMQATFLRQIWAIAMLTALGAAMGALRQWSAPLKNPRLIGALVVAAIVGAFLGTWLSVAALKFTHASVAAALNATSPLFILPLAALWLKEHVSAQAIAGAVVAVGGVVLYFSTLH